MRYLIIELDEELFKSKRQHKKLTEDAVRKIREEYSDGCVTYCELAKKYNVHATTIGRVVRRQDWRHIK